MSSMRSIRLSMFGSAVAALFMLAACESDSGKTQGNAPILAVQVVEAETRDVPLSLDMVGTTLGTQDVPIRARVEGFVETMEFSEGTFVEKGDLLYTIDPQPFQAKLVEAQSQLAAARTNLIKAQSDLSRIKPLAEMKAVSEQDLDSAVAQEAAMRAAVKASEAAVDLANIELSYTRIQAPIDGLIGLTKAKPGEFVGRDPNPVVLNTLSDIDPIRVRFSISEREYLIMARTYMEGNAQTRRGEPGVSTPDPLEKGNRETGESRSGRKNDLTLVLADNSEHDHKGHVVAASQAINQETGTYTIEAAFPNPRLYLLPGQFARVRANYEVLEDVVVIPRKAISELQGLFRVYVVGDGDEVAVREIKLGPQTGHDVVIESGLNAGERVIVEGIQKVRPGMKVKPVPAGASPDASAQG